MSGATADGDEPRDGPDGCRYGRSFATDGTAPDDTVTATDIVAYEPPSDPDDSPDAVSLKLTGRGFPGGPSGTQRLVHPSVVAESDAGLCHSCRTRLEDHQRRRGAVIGGLKQVTATLRPMSGSIDVECLSEVRDRPFESVP